jgi:2,4-dienoyl-CoA reductase-like NADH-dependent reductase (Old Yellow Enzyme family)
MIITCAASVIPSGRAWEGQLHVETDEQARALIPLATKCKTEDCLSLVQLHHGGVASSAALTGSTPLSASSAFVEGIHKESPRAASHEEITEFISAFASAAARVVNAGIDGVEIHGANGYLVTQFLSTFFNTRNDEWGGSREKRAKLLFEIVRACRQSIGANKILGVRLSPTSRPSYPSLDAMDVLWTAQELCNLGVDYIHLSLWNAFEVPDEFSSTVTEVYRRLLPKSVALLGAGGLCTRTDAERYLALGADFVALGKTAIGNPDWPLRIQDPASIPDAFPMTAEKLASVGVSPAFVSYLREFKSAQFVK